MKKHLSCLCTALLAAALLAGCAGAESQPAATPQPTASTPTSTPQPSPAPTPAPTPEPEGEEVDSLDAFLTEEQAALCAQAEEAYYPLRFDPFYAVHQNGWEFSEEEPVGWSGHRYAIVTGPGATLEEYREQLLQIFTPNFLKGSEFDKRFISVDGQLAIADFGIGSDITVSDVPDTYQLVSKDENQVEFLRIVHYVNEREGESTDDFIARRNSSYDYTKEMPIRLVNSEDGWRVDEFDSP